MTDTLRIDKWLWASRFYKTRSLASDAVNGGHVHLNGQRSKSSKSVRVGDELKIRKAGHTFIVTVTNLSERRGSASEASKLYEEHEDSIQARELHQSQRRMDALANPRPTSRPDKRQRRQLKNWQLKQ